MPSPTAVVHRLLSHVFGKEFLDDLAVFFQDFQGLYDGFRERHETVVGLLRAPSTGFVTVCAPTRSSLDIAAYFVEELGRRELPRAGVIVNQVHRCEGRDHDADAVLGELARALGAEFDPSVAGRVRARLGMAHRRLAAIVDAERAMVSQLRHEARGGGFYQEIARLPGQVHDLEALTEVGERLFRPACSLG